MNCFLCNFFLSKGSFADPHVFHVFLTNTNLASTIVGERSRVSVVKQFYPVKDKGNLSFHLILSS